MRIDAQVGFVDRTRFSYPWLANATPHMQRDFSPADLSRILTRNKYEGALAAPLLQDPAEVDWLLEQAQQHIWITGVIGNALEDRWLTHRKFVAVRWRLPDADRSAIEETVSASLAVEFVARPEDAASIDNLVNGLPPGRVVVVPVVGPNWDPAPWQRVARNELISVKVCGLINEAGPDAWKAETYRPFVQRMLEWCGPERLMYGSDWPRCMHTGTWKESLAAFTQALGAQSIETRSRILGENAATIYARKMTY
jgi:L-fuconolactonase